MSEKVIILINAGDRVLTYREMEDILTLCDGTTWYQVVAPAPDDPEMALNLSQDIACLCSGDLTGREL